MAPISLIQEDACIVVDCPDEVHGEKDCCKAGKTPMRSEPDEEDIRTLGKQCRFGKTPLETRPATPSGFALSFDSPPGFSRAALRRARDAAKLPVNPVSTARFGETAFGTVPKTPSGGAKLKALAEAFGSPPGLSRAEMRHARDALKAPSLVKASTSWESQSTGSLTFDFAVSSRKQPSARERLGQVKRDAAFLKDLRNSREHQVSKNAAEEGECSACVLQDSDSLTMLEASLANEFCDITSQQCRFGDSALGTVPSTPLGGRSSLSSPPGLSRKALRQARDTWKGSLPAPHARKSCTGVLSCSAMLTIDPSGKPISALPRPLWQNLSTCNAVGSQQMHKSMSTSTLQSSHAPR